MTAAMAPTTRALGPFSKSPPATDIAPAAGNGRCEPTNVEATLPWEIFICRACGWLYDESKGDEDSGLAAGTRFADIPDDWAGPLCGVTKSDFEPYINDLHEARPKGARRTPRSPVTAGARANTKTGVVIVGAGRAGWQMAQTLRERDADLPITLVTRCNGDVYDKPLLSVAMARGIAVSKLPKEKGADAARRLNVKLLANTAAVRTRLPAASCAPAAARCATTIWCWRTGPKRGPCRCLRRGCAGASTIWTRTRAFAPSWPCWTGSPSASPWSARG